MLLVGSRGLPLRMWWLGGGELLGGGAWWIVGRDIDGDTVVLLFECFG